MQFYVLLAQTYAVQSPVDYIQPNPVDLCLSVQTLSVWHDFGPFVWPSFNLSVFCWHGPWLFWGLYQCDHPRHTSDFTDTEDGPSYHLIILIALLVPWCICAHIKATCALCRTVYLLVHLGTISLSACYCTYVQIDLTAYSFREVMSRYHMRPGFKWKYVLIWRISYMML